MGFTGPISYAFFGGMVLNVVAILVLRVASRLFQPDAVQDPEVLFCPDNRQACRKFLDGRCLLGDNCQFTHEVTVLSRLVQLIRKAKRTLDICVYLLTCPVLAKALTDRVKRGVKVRVITEICNADGSGSQIEALRPLGVEIKMNSPPSLMHHKFAVIDGSTLINGSFNWTQQAVSLNWENVVVTREPKMVQPFAQEFERLWEKFTPLAVVHDAKYFYAENLVRQPRKRLL